MIISSEGIRGEITADVVVVGAGPGGITTALELADGGLSVVLVESGADSDVDPAAQRLGDIAELDPDRHSPASLTNRRQVGGASAIWGGRCVPYDPIDFDARDLVGSSRWPLSYDELAPYFGRACDWMQCGRPVFDASADPVLAQRSLVPGWATGGEVRSTDLERWSLPTNFGTVYHDRLIASQRLRVFTSMTCTRIVPRAIGPGIDHVEARTADGSPVQLRAREFVLACGGLETTRLLLASPTAAGPAIGDHSGHLGRWYMAHLEGTLGQVVFTTPPEETIYDYERDGDGVYVRRRMTLSRELLLKENLPNIAFWLGNHQLADAAHGSGPLSAVYLALTSPLGGVFAPEAQRKSLTGEVVPGAPYGGGPRSPKRAHVRNVVRNVGATARFTTDFGRRRMTGRRRAPGFYVPRADNAYPLMYHAEHLPAAQSRVWLTEQRDALGLPRLGIDLRFAHADLDGVVRAHEQLDGYLRRTGLGRLELTADDRIATVDRQAGGGFHQVGTTRIADDPRNGVVDPDLAVHGQPNLHLVSSSTFVTSGQANSTFMIVAFAVRLARRLLQHSQRVPISGAQINGHQATTGQAKV